MQARNRISHPTMRATGKTMRELSRPRNGTAVCPAEVWAEHWRRRLTKNSCGFPGAVLPDVNVRGTCWRCDPWRKHRRRNNLGHVLDDADAELVAGSTRSRRSVMESATALMLRAAEPVQICRSS